MNISKMSSTTSSSVGFGLGRSSSSPRPPPAHKRAHWMFLLFFLTTALNVAVHYFYLIGGAGIINENTTILCQTATTRTSSRSSAIARSLEEFAQQPKAAPSQKIVDNSQQEQQQQQQAPLPPPPPPPQHIEEEDACELEYQRVTSNDRTTTGLTPENIRRSWAHVGSRKRLAELGQKLLLLQQQRQQEQQEPIVGVVSGGSISLGHGVVEHLRYSNRLEQWLNEYFPLLPPPKPDGESSSSSSSKKQHQILNRGSHGADICAMAKRLTLLIQDLPPHVDLFVLEFAVNDYQGQDHKTQIDFKMDVFFEGFENIAMCTETVLHRLLHHYPQAAIVFLEMRTSIVARKTASLLHMGAAQHYQIPVISYEQALFPDYQYLLEVLKPFNYSTRKGDTVLPYPHGCHPCVPEHMIDQFRVNGCMADLCRMQRTGGAADAPKDCKILPEGREPCHIPFFAHDEIHPSGIGHKIAADLIIDAIASTARDVCQKSETFARKAILPSTGWMVSDPIKLDQRYNFMMVNDTFEIFVKKRMLEASNHSAGFTYFADSFGRFGWIATNPVGGESIQFDIDLPVVQSGQCYVPYLAVLKSYENMGAFTVTVLDRNTKQRTNIEVDGLWKPRISVPSDIPLAEDTASPMACTGQCSIIVTTKPKLAGREGNKVKIVTLSVRKCIK